MADAADDRRAHEAAQHEAREIRRADEADIEARELLAHRPQRQQHAVEAVAHEQDGAAQQERRDGSEQGAHLREIQR